MSYLDAIIKRFLLCRPLYLAHFAHFTIFKSPFIRTRVNTDKSSCPFEIFLWQGVTVQTITDYDRNKSGWSLQIFQNEAVLYLLCLRSITRFPLHYCFLSFYVFSKRFSPWNERKDNFSAFFHGNAISHVSSSLRTMRDKICFYENLYVILKRNPYRFEV